MKSVQLRIALALLCSFPLHAGQNPSINQLKETIAQCPAAATLLNLVKTKVAKEGQTLKLFLEAKETFTTPSHAFCNSAEGRIYIKADVSFLDKLKGLVFELGNLSQKQALDSIYEARKQGRLSREDFTYQLSELEYRTMKIYNEVVSSCKRTSGWDQSIKEYDMGISFESYWISKLRDSYHSDIYRQQYDALSRLDKLKKLL